MSGFRKIIAVIIAAGVVLSNAAGFVFAQNTEEKIELPFDEQYDNIGGYDYPYLIPPPKILNLGGLGMYQENQSQSKDDGPKLFYVVKPADPNIYWKERTYDVYTGQGWLIQNIDTRNAEKNKKNDKTPIAFDVYKYMSKGSYNLDLIVPFTKQSFIDKSSLELDPVADYDLSTNTYDDYTFKSNVSADTSLKYRAEYYAPDFDIRKGGSLKDVPKEIIEAYTQLPEKFPQELKDIANGLAIKSDRDLPSQILDTYKFVQENVEYDLKWGAGKTIPKDYDMALWTYENKKGICSHFATLFIALARAQGIPTRLAVGFAGGKVKDDSVLIYSSYAHAWVEVYLPNYGWVTIDPTKGSRGGEDGQQQQQPNPDDPPEWSNGGNVRPDLKFTLDDELQKEKEKQDDSNQDGNSDNGDNNNNQDGNNGDGGGGGGSGGQGGGGGGGGQGGSSSGGGQGFNGDTNQLPNLDKWFTDDDARKLEEEYEKWQNEQKLADNSQNPDVDKTDGNSGDPENSDKGDGKKDSDENKNDPNKEEDKNESLVSDITKAVSSIGKNSQANILPLALIAIFFAAAYFIYGKYSKTSVLRNKIEERIRSVNRFVDIAKVIENVKAYGAKEEYGAAAIYGYNELADYIAYVFDVINDPALTAREFESLVKETALLQPLNIIIGIFERAKYSHANSQEDYNNFLAALYGIANTSKIKK